MSPIIGHTSGTSHNTVCTEEDDDYDNGVSTGYASVTDLRISRTKKEYDYEDDDKDFYKFNEDSVHPDWRYRSKACCELRFKRSNYDYEASVVTILENDEESDTLRRKK